MRSASVLLALLLCSAAVAHAQTPLPATPTSVDILVLPPGSDPATAAPIATLNTPISASQGCNLNGPAAPPVPLVNPTAAFFDDPFNAGRFCRAAMPSGLPVGQNYIAVAQLVAPTCMVNNITLTPCPSLRSAVGTPPFSIQPILSRPAVPTNLVVRP